MIARWVGKFSLICVNVPKQINITFNEAHRFSIFMTVVKKK